METGLAEYRRTVNAGMLPAPCACGCGGTAWPNGIYSTDCLIEDGDAVPATDDDLDIKVVTLADRAIGGGPRLRRLRRYGPGKCVRCQRDTMPGRLYCSRGCRREKGQFKILVDGYLMTPVDHVRRVGMNPSTLARRLQLGMSFEEALSKPVSLVHRSRALKRSAAGERAGEDADEVS